VGGGGGLWLYSARQLYLFSNWHVRGMGVGGHGIGMRSGNWGKGMNRLFFEFWGLDVGCTLGWSLDRLCFELCRFYCVF